MKHIIVLAFVLFSTAANADWTPGTVLLGQFQQELYSAHHPQELRAAGICSRLKSHLSALIGWSKQTESKVLP
ncbi:MAG: hypothetical protein J0H42_07740 [Rhizobiales bacterium]|nr:hypothetical protein [Hyphomicrobiales bacterium]